MGYASWPSLEPCLFGHRQESGQPHQLQRDGRPCASGARDARPLTSVSKYLFEDSGGSCRREGAWN
eukprot:2841829-Prorocentrum_lima.AAC.1